MARMLHLYRRYWPDEGGVECVMRPVCEYTVQNGHEAVVVCGSRYPWSRSDSHNGVKIVRCSTVCSPANTPLCPTMPRIIRSLRPDVLELHHAYPWGQMAILNSGYDGPLVFSYHFDIARFGKLIRFIQPSLEGLHRRADRIIINSRVYAETSEVIGPWLDKCEVIPPGVDPDEFALTPERAARAEQLRRSGRFRVVFVGRLSHYKGLFDLLTAMQWVDGELDIIGRGGLAARLRARIEELGLGERVRMHGRLEHDELVAYYHAADVAVLPSTVRGEAFGIAQVEAMMSGTPVVCSDLPGVSSVGADGVTGLVFPRGDVRALAETLNALAGDEERRRRMGEAAHDHALEKYSLKYLLDKRMQLYETLMGSLRQPLVEES